jgi:hypothetical protein
VSKRTRNKSKRFKSPPQRLRSKFEHKLLRDAPFKDYVVTESGDIRGRNKKKDLAKGNRQDVSDRNARSYSLSKREAIRAIRIRL